jgi:hypothetical protein
LTSSGNVKSLAEGDPLKYTAALVEQKCPRRLYELGEQIAAHLEKAAKCEEKAEQHYTTAGQLLAQVRELCDEDGFHAVREKFFPDLGRSRAYEILQVAAGKKSIEDIRAGTRERMRRHRASRALSVTVTDAPTTGIGQPAKEHKSRTLNPKPLPDIVDGCVAAVLRRVEDTITEIQNHHKNKSRKEIGRLFAALADSLTDLGRKELSADDIDVSAAKRKAHYTAIGAQQ